MNWDDFGNLLRHLHPETLARIVVDLENAQEDWAFYPEDAPPEAIQEMVDEALTLIISIGEGRAEAKNVEFRHLLEQLRDEQDEKDWAETRDQQEIKNWLDDYK